MLQSASHLSPLVQSHQLIRTVLGRHGINKGRNLTIQLVQIASKKRIALKSLNRNGRLIDDKPQFTFPKMTPQTFRLIFEKRIAALNDTIKTTLVNHLRQFLLRTTRSTQGQFGRRKSIVGLNLSRRNPFTIHALQILGIPIEHNRLVSCTTQETHSRQGL